MKVTIDIPDAVEQSLPQGLREDAAGEAKRALAISWYREEKISIGQAAEMLGITVYEAEGLMKQRGVRAPFSEQDYEHDRQTLDRLFVCTGLSDEPKAQIR